MANQRRLADNAAHFEAGHSGVPRKGAALLQGIAICGRCGRRMSMRYTGPNADYPVYCCRSDRDQEGTALCQELRASAVDALVQRVVLDALLPDQDEIALAAASQLAQDSRQLERQWALRVERARYEAERARRQYDAAEPENRLMARSLERAREEKLRAVEAVEQEHARLARATAASDWPGGTRRATSTRREPAAHLESGHHVGSRSQAHSAICHKGTNSVPAITSKTVWTAPDWAKGNIRTEDAAEIGISQTELLAIAPFHLAGGRVAERTR
ncbi:zinc ribbon domain-containing protein [Bradyrhizobium sp. 187]|uniref:zinc ribbon domain-containing protein n=1 Tax=Bradyrhizobium sp. 187 TaxID=2782655 RepID=UPI001FFE83B2|nr:zinc ribbon domain-containing protein [Bradyrhizobium sp. 187]